ncbi:MAG: tRNA lysidine(34) synthetase TilS [Alphaproteobacteria bacterium]
MSAEPVPLGAAEFARRMADFGPFERPPLVAVAVSGGADSTALCLLAAEWAQERGGRCVALTVDHGLRPESAAEARAVGRRLRARGIAHRILAWEGDKPRSGVQAAARDARYALLGEYCRRRSILHILLAHHREDQAETVLMRLGRGSGPDGLAAMAPVVERPDWRLLRPFLNISRVRLRATLTVRAADWIEDPSNQDTAYARVRLRRLMPDLAREGLTAEGLAGSAGRLGALRADREASSARLLARAVEIRPEGFAILDRAIWREAPPEIAAHALTRLILAVGGGAYPPRGARRARLGGVLRAPVFDSGRTLGGCRFLPRGKNGVLICREPSAAGARVDLAPREEIVWDRRFGVRRGPAGGTLTVARLGRGGWAQLVEVAPETRFGALPAPVRASLPALFSGARLMAVPHLGFSQARVGHVDIRFRSAHPLAEAGFALLRTSE